MASPIHNFLFDPIPLSAPPENSTLKSPTLASIASFLLPAGCPRASDVEDADTRKTGPPLSVSRSCLTIKTGLAPSNDDFDSSLEDTPRAKPRQTFEVQHPFFAPAYECTPTNIPTARSPLPAGLPRPLIRLLVFIVSSFSIVLVLHHVPASRFLPFGRDDADYPNTKMSMTKWDATGRNYIPPQAYSKRLSPYGNEQDELDFTQLPRKSVPHPRTMRPAAGPLPPALELLALQSYLLQSRYNVLPSGTDASAPLDANAVLGFNADVVTLTELEAELAHEVVVWYGGNGLPTLPHDVLNTLFSIHGGNRHPILLPLHGRPDLERLLAIVSRLGYDLDKYPLLMIGNRAFSGHSDNVKEMSSSGRLESLLASIGRSNGISIDVAKKKVKRSPKVAKIERRALSEVDAAIRDNRKARNAEKRS